MPLYADGIRKIRINLKAIQDGQKPKLVRIGVLSPEQLKVINQRRSERGWEPLCDIVVFLGKHMYDSRCIEDSYTIEEVIGQIQSAFSDKSTVLCERASAALRNSTARIDKDGNRVNDEAVFECTSRHPYPELYSVAPKGDGKAPHQKAKDPSTRGLR